MNELRLLAPEAATLLLLPRGVRPKGESEYLRQRVPFRLQGCTVRRAYRSLPGDPLHRTPYLILRPGAPAAAAEQAPPSGSSESAPGKGRIFLHPLLFALLLRRGNRPVQVEWGTHREPLPGAAVLPDEDPHASRPRVLRATALLALARRRPLRLLLLLLCHLRLLPVLLLSVRKPRHGPSNLYAGLALLSALLLLLTTPAAMRSQPSSTERPEPPVPEPALAPTEASRALPELTELLTLLFRAPGEVTVEVIEGSSDALRLSLRVTDVDGVKTLLEERYQSAMLEIRSSNWLLAEAAGTILCTIELQ